MTPITRSCIQSLKQIELEVLFWLCRDKSTTQIADEVSTEEKIYDEATINYHLKKVYDLFGIEGDGREKREKLIQKVQKELDSLYPTKESLKDHLRKIPVECINCSFMFTIMQELPNVDLFSAVEFDFTIKEVRMVVKKKYSKEYFQSALEEFKTKHMSTKGIWRMNFTDDPDADGELPCQITS